MPFGSAGNMAVLHLLLSTFEDFDHVLNQGVLIDNEDNEDRTLLSYLAEDGHTNAVKKALEHGANINHFDLFGNTALDYAAWAGRTETIWVLRECGGKLGSDLG